MLQALLHRKLQRWLTKDPATIEDLLTSVVLGTASYMPELALLPFLRTAESPAGEYLGSSLEGLKVSEVRFWPNWSAIEHDVDSDVGDTGDDDGPGVSVRVPRSQPEVVVELVDAEGRLYMLLLEAKLASGKSSHAGEGVSVTDQLGKYWLHLGDAAKHRKATPLAVIYVTASATMPKQELAATQQELVSKKLERAPLFWLSWRKFTTVIDVESAPPMLQDCITLVRERWGLEYVEMRPFARPDPLPAPWRLQSQWRWHEPRPLPMSWSSSQGTEHD